MKIAICDDVLADRDTLIDYLRRALDARRLSGEIRAFESGERLLDAISAEHFPICFLDIYMQGISGVGVARKIREKDKQAAIVFTTSSKEHMAEGFEVGAAHYLVKPYTRQAVDEALERCIRQAGQPEKYLEILANRRARQVLFSQIRYVESRDKSCTVYATGEELRTWASLDELEGQLNDPRFLRCHRSYIVNMDFVSDVRGKDFLLTDGGLIPIRREDYQQMRDIFDEYSFEKMRRR